MEWRMTMTTNESLKSLPNEGLSAYLLRKKVFTKPLVLFAKIHKAKY